MLAKLCLYAVAALALLPVFANAQDKKSEDKKDETKNPIVVIETSLGTMEVELFADKAPITVKNFLGYVDDKFYDGLIFHRVINTFMVQGGGFEPGLKKKDTKAAIENEASNGLSNEVGTIAMARTQVANSATSQFFINTANNSKILDKASVRDGVGYCVFGKLVKGTDVLDVIKDVEVKASPMNSREISSPVKDVTIKSIRVKK